MRAVFDTNVLISSLITRNSIPAEAVRQVQKKGKIFLTKPTLNELITVLQRKKFDRYADTISRKIFIDDIISIADIIFVPHPIKACRDPNDDKFLEAAVHGDADYLITGDADLLVLNPFMKIRILSPAEFLRIIA